MLGYHIAQAEVLISFVILILLIYLIIISIVIIIVIVIIIIDSACAIWYPSIGYPRIFDFVLVFV